MSVRELNSEQREILKQMYMLEKADKEEYSSAFNVDWGAPSYGELLNADELVSDEEIFSEYEGISFVDADFALV